MINKLYVNFKNLTVVDQFGLEVNPFKIGETKESVRAAIEIELRTFKKITTDAKSYISQFPTVESFRRASSERSLQNFDGRDVFRKLANSHFIVDIHPIILKDIVESLILENFYNDVEAVKNTKELYDYDNLCSQYSQLPIERFFKTKMFA